MIAVLCLDNAYVARFSRFACIIALCESPVLKFGYVLVIVYHVFDKSALARRSGIVRIRRNKIYKCVLVILLTALRKSVLVALKNLLRFLLSRFLLLVGRIRSGFLGRERAENVTYAYRLNVILIGRAESIDYINVFVGRIFSHFARRSVIIAVIVDGIYPVCRVLTYRRRNSGVIGLMKNGRAVLGISLLVRLVIRRILVKEEDSLLLERVLGVAVGFNRGDKIIGLSLCVALCLIRVGSIGSDIDCIPSEVYNVVILFICGILRVDLVVRYIIIEFLCLNVPESRNILLFGNDLSEQSLGDALAVLPA